MGISIVIPSRHERYIQKTIQSLLKSARGSIEILAILDGYWCDPEEIVLDKRVNYIHFTKPRGMRSAINAGVALAKYDYILKTDAHCLFAEGFDEALKKDMKDDWVVVPRRYALDIEAWDIEKRTDNKYPIDYMFLDKDMKGQVWTAKNRITDTLPKIDDIVTAQGSCWFMKKEYYNKLGLLDEETYGTFWNEFQEIGIKCYKAGGKVKVNKNTWYAHWHKTEGRGYNLREDSKKALEALRKIWIT